MEKVMNEKIIMNYEVVELLHKSSSWGNIVFKVKPQNKEKLYVLKCFPKIENGLQKLIFKREIEALRTLNVCEGIVKLRDSSTELYPFKENECYGGILMDYVPGETLDHINWNKYTQLLNKNTPLLEDFRAKTMAYKRQFRAIFDLKKDEYSARSLKDIILCLDEPEEIKTISQPSFISKVLNQSQKQAVMKALNTENICLIQGPPGTGKTSVIKEIVGQIIKRDIKMTDSPKILIVSQSHTAVDNILEGLGKAIDNPLEIIRIGAERNISEEIATKYTIAAHREQLVSEIKNNVQQYVEQKNDLMNTITDKNEVKKWEEVKKIQEDWINRLVDQNSLDYQMIRSAVVIAGTCVGFLSNEVIKDMSFDYVIIDEAAKATTPELLVSIIKAKKIILVGDQNQLPAYADAEVSPTLAKLTKNPDYRLFDILYNSLPDTHKQILTTQYRMIENIGNLISKVFYRGIIDTGCNDDEKRHGLSRYVGKSIVWFDTSANKKKSQKRTKGGSYINEEEKRIILEILDDLKSTGELKGLDMHNKLK